MGHPSGFRCISDTVGVKSRFGDARVVLVHSSVVCFCALVCALVLVRAIGASLPFGVGGAVCAVPLSPYAINC